MALELWKEVDYDRVELTEIGIKIDSAIDAHCRDFKIGRSKLVKMDHKLIAERVGGDVKQGHVRAILDLD